ncbi:response regulator transcription factor [Candidatus Auribacterota bacterium]
MPKTKILIVEDEVSIRELIRMGLSKEGYEIAEAGDGFSIGSILFDFIPDLILLDLHMPTADGYTVLENVQKFYLKKKKVPPKILVVSAFIDDTTLPEIKALPASDWLSKPFHIDDLKKKVKNLLKE